MSTQAPIVRVGKAPHGSDLIDASCSECGDLTEWETDEPVTRDRLRRTAARHAEEAHEGLVDAVGWVR